MTSPKHQVEALLFSSGKAMTIDQITELSKLEKQKATRALKALKKDYEERDGAITIFQDGHEWKMSVKNEFLMLVKDIVADTELSKPCLETLSVIAYEHPKAMQAEVVNTRGSGAYEHIAELEKLGFLRKEKRGRSFALKLSEKFFDYFDVAGEKDIRAAFKNVKKPEKQAKLGSMDVVDVEPEKPDEPVPLEVHEKEAHVKPELDEAHQNFLDDLDKRIDSISGKNDKNDDDPALKRLSDGEPDDGEASEDEPEETPSEESKDN